MTSVTHVSGPLLSLTWAFTLWTRVGDPLFSLGDRT